MTRHDLRHLMHRLTLAGEALTPLGTRYRRMRAHKRNHPRTAHD